MQPSSARASHPPPRRPPSPLKPHHSWRPPSLFSSLSPSWRSAERLSPVPRWGRGSPQKQQSSPQRCKPLSIHIGGQSLSPAPSPASPQGVAAWSPASAPSPLEPDSEEVQSPATRRPGRWWSSLSPSKALSPQRWRLAAPPAAPAGRGSPPPRSRGSSPVKGRSEQRQASPQASPACFRWLRARLLESPHQVLGELFKAADGGHVSLHAFASQLSALGLRAPASSVRRLYSAIGGGKPFGQGALLNWALCGRAAPVGGGGSLSPTAGSSSRPSSPDGRASLWGRAVQLLPRPPTPAPLESSALGPLHADGRPSGPREYSGDELEGSAASGSDPPAAAAPASPAPSARRTPVPSAGASRERTRRPSSAAEVALARGLKPHIKSPDPKRRQRTERFRFSAANVAEMHGVDRFDHEPDSDEHPFWDQGNRALHTPRTLERRAALLASGKIASACRQFYDCLRLPPGGRVSRLQYFEARPKLTRPYGACPCGELCVLPAGASTSRRCSRTRPDARAMAGGMRGGLGERPARRRPQGGADARGTRHLALRGEMRPAQSREKAEMRSLSRLEAHISFLPRLSLWQVADLWTRGTEALGSLPFREHATGVASQRLLCTGARLHHLPEYALPPHHPAARESRQAPTRVGKAGAGGRPARLFQRWRREYTRPRVPVGRRG